MQLSKIKMSGFKSFVDPTTITMPSHLMAVVGPNGCGKSNIIDAVTWVMGESSPKYLRGEALTDVIFNGSTARKPVGQASVELIFDNSDGTIGGEYAKFAEISVRRQINRESDSTYYLNGVRCRKRDVVDIFLGTGLGPRSYSIIGQNMISRIIEAKPDELRTYLEEAAGISKYKERRHETELRINHTKDNLARINDLRGELEKQLSHLKHQANVAEKYKNLKQQERILRAELYGIQWRQLDTKMVDHTLKIQREETALEARNSEITHTDREIEQLRHEQRVAHDAFQEVQRRYYSVGNEITRIEQEMLHHQERQMQWENDLKQTENDWQTVHDDMQTTEETLQEIEHDIQSVEPQINQVNQEVVTSQHKLVQAEEMSQSLQNQWDEFHQSTSNTSQTAQVEKTHIQHLEQRIDSLQKRQTQLQHDQTQFNFTALSAEIEGFSQQSDEMSEKLEYQNQQLSETRDQINDSQRDQQEANKQLDAVRSDLQRLRGQQASLEALQQTALGQRDNSTGPWVKQHQLGNKPRLAQHIEVENGWELAVEKVLGVSLQAICMDQFNEIIPHLNDFKNGNLCLFNANADTATRAAGNKGTTLLSKVKSQWPLDALIGGIYVVDTDEEAIALSKTLNADESVISKDGVWAGRSWLKLLRENDPAAGIFQREQALKQLVMRIEELQAKQDELEEAIAARKQEIQQLEVKRDQLQHAYNQQQAQSAQIQAQHKMKQARLVELQAQAQRFKNEETDCLNQLDQANAELQKARGLWEAALNQLDTQAKQRDELIKQRDQARANLQNYRDALNHQKEMFHELEIRLQTAKSQKASLKQNVTRLQSQLASLNDRKISLQSDLSSMQPIDVIKKSLARSLDKHVSVEAELNTARVAMDALDQEFRNLEEKRQTIERDINKVRSSLESFRLDWQSWKVKSDTILEQIKETEFTIEDILKDLAQDITSEEWQVKLDQVVTRINRLGPINLVAIEEYTTCLERKQYLDDQINDLQAGLATLEDAIHKIDKETKTRFKETFDKVNGRFQELFPTVFGGGKAYLELNSDDLLEAGVTMMACPPGKRNSSIYLLSGGEKSLTAIALIFSIFYLNPAPFCLLDEVDAALDDANVLRFTRLVKAMADKTQFIFISHNKITIEMGEHLIGVTMNEPGVSRLVSVDIAKAISLAEQ